MIRAVTVTNYLGESKRFELAFPEESGFAVQSISGLGPSKADINTTEISTNDGSLYNSARVNSRNIVMSLKLMFNPQIEDTRHDSYKYFPIKKRVTPVSYTHLDVYKRQLQFYRSSVPLSQMRLGTLGKQFSQHLIPQVLTRF